MTYPNPTTSVLPVTEVDAVNFMLKTVGESTVTSLSGTIPEDATIAQTTLYETLVEVLSEGWYFNSYENKVITADGSGYLNLPTGALSVFIDPSTSFSYDVVQKGTKLWDRRNQTYVFPSGTQVTCAVIEMMDFADLPPYARWYITCRAAHIFADRVMGAPNVHAYVAEQELKARAVMVQKDTDAGRYNFFNNQSVYRVVDRNMGGSGYTNFYAG